MNFSEKVNMIFQILDCSNAEIARVSGIDPSLVSRFRTGSRHPRSNSSQFMHFCKGIVTIAQINGNWELLQEACQLAEVEKREDEISAYLIGKNDNTKSRTLHKKRTNTLFCTFGEKLNAIMNMLDISNIRLARALNVDTSLISRFRNGFRTPPKNSSLMVSLCNYFYKIVKISGMENELSELLGVSRVMVEYGGDEFNTYFIHWFSNENELQDTGDMDSFLEKLDHLSNMKIPVLPPLHSIFVSELQQDDSSEYTGIDGLRRAVIRFLGSVAQTGRSHTLKLYSDQNLDWMSSDLVFTQKWAALMYTVLLNKSSVKIIHNIDRNLTEMLIGIEKWLPLYMTGLVEGYYCKNTVDGRFTHSLFVASETAAIHSCLVAGTENNGVYQYVCNQESIQYYEKQFDALQDISMPLIQVFKKSRINDYHFFINEMSKTVGDMKRLLLSPSLATIPRTLLEKMLNKNKVETTKTEEILAFHEIRSKLFDNELENGNVVEYIVLPEEEELLSGNIKLNLSDIFTEMIIKYSPEEYSEHIKAIVTLLKNNNYDVIPLLESPFANIQMTVKERVGAIIQKTELPIRSFRFSHPLMCKAINNYIDAIGRRSKLQINSKNEVINYLGKYMR